MKFKPLLLILVPILFSLSSNAQCINGSKSIPIYKTGEKLIKKFDKLGSEIVRIEYDLVFSSKNTYRDLSPNWDYKIIGFADKGVKDLDLKVLQYDVIKGEWIELGSDVSNKSYASVIIRPNRVDTFKIEISVYEYFEGYSAARYGLIIVHD